MGTYGTSFHLGATGNYLGLCVWNIYDFKFDKLYKCFGIGRTWTLLWPLAWAQCHYPSFAASQWEVSGLWTRYTIAITYLAMTLPQDVFIYCCPDCPCCLAHLNNIGRTTWAIWAAGHHIIFPLKFLLHLWFIWIKYDLDRSMTHPNFDPTGVQTHDL